MISLRSLLFGRQEQKPDHVSHLPITRPAPDWNCYKPTPWDEDRPPEQDGGRFSRRYVAQCQNCQGMHPVDLEAKVILKHPPSPPTVEFCDCGERYHEVDDLPVYMGKEGKPTCAACAMAEPTGYDDDGNPLHGAPSWLDDMGV
jgi:hypothetical protein